MPFTADEIAYMRSQPLARVATVSADGQPDVVPLAFEFDGQYFWVGGSGESVQRTRKFCNVRAGNHQVAIVIDDMVSFEPFIARSIRIYGLAEQPVERDGMVGPGTRAQPACRCESGDARRYGSRFVQASSLPRPRGVPAAFRGRLVTDRIIPASAGSTEPTAKGS